MSSKNNYLSIFLRKVKICLKINFKNFFKYKKSLIGSAACLCLAVFVFFFDTIKDLFIDYKTSKSLHRIEANTSLQNILKLKDNHKKLLKLENFCNDFGDTEACSLSKEYVAEIKDPSNLNRKNNVDYGRRCDFATSENPDRIYQSASLASNSIKFSYEINTSIAIPDCHRAIEQYPNEPRYKYQLAISYRARARSQLPQSSDYLEAEKYFRQAVSQGHKASYSHLGYLIGGGNIKKYKEPLKEAFSLFNEGFNKGSIEAKVALAYYHQYGFGTSPNRELAKTFYEEAEQENSAEAAYNLGNFYLYGFDKTKKPNPYQALQYYQRAADLGDSNGYVKIASLYTKGLLGNKTQSDIQIIENNLKSATDANNAWAYHYKGWMYQYGHIYEQSDELALKNYLEGYKRNYGYSAINLGDAYAFGLLGKSKNQELAFQFYNDAIKFGENDGYLKFAKVFNDGTFFPVSDEADTTAYTNIKNAINSGGGNWAHRYLAWVKLHGRGVNKDETAAKEEFTKLLEERNDADSAILLGVIARDNNELEDAEKYFLRAKELNDYDASWYLAELKYSGDYGSYITPNKDKVAFNIIGTGVERKNASATNALGWMYQQGIGTEKDLDEAIKFYKQALVLGSEYSAENLGQIYKNSMGDYQAAYDYFQKAINLGNSNGFGYINDMLIENEIFADKAGKIFFRADGEVDQKQSELNHKKAFKLIQNAVRKFPKNDWLLVKLGWNYEQGFGVKQDTKQAKYYYTKAAEQNNNWARKRLITLKINGMLDESDTYSAKKEFAYLISEEDLGALNTKLYLKLLEIFEFANTDSKLFKRCEDVRNLYKRMLVSSSYRRDISTTSDLFNKGFPAYALNQIYATSNTDDALPTQNFLMSISDLSECGDNMNIFHDHNAMASFIRENNLAGNYLAIKTLAAKLHNVDLIDRENNELEQKYISTIDLIAESFPKLDADGFLSDCKKLKNDFGSLITNIEYFHNFDFNRCG